MCGLIIYFRDEIREILRELGAFIGRVRSAEGFGVKLDAEGRIRQTGLEVIQTTNAAEEALPEVRLDVPPVDLSALPQTGTLAEPELVLTQEDRRSEVMSIATQLEREVKLLAISKGINSLQLRTLALLQKVQFELNLPESLIDSYRAFRDLRNEVAHNWEKALIPDEVLASGRELLRIFREIPRARLVVVHPHIALYSDPACAIRVQSFFGVMLQSFGSEGVASNRQIFPTSRNYRRNALVTWEWDMSQTIGLFYYRDPFDNDEPRRGSDSSAAFAGRDLDTLL